MHVAVFPVTAAFRHRVSVPRLNVTVPAPLGEGLIVAVKVTESLYVLGFALLDSAVDVVAVGGVVE